MNSVELIAEVKEKIDDIYRYIEYALPCYNEENESSQKIVARYWPKIPKGRFSILKEGSLIAIRGHLDACKKFGTIIVVEQFETLPLK